MFVVEVVIEIYGYFGKVDVILFIIVGLIVWWVSFVVG